MLVIYLCQDSANSGPLPVYINKNLLERDPAHLFMCRQWQFSPYNRKAE